MSDQIRSKIDEITSSKSRFEAVLMSMFDGIMVVDAKGAILLMNQPIKDILLIKDEPIGRKPIEIVRNPEKDLPRLFERFYRVDKARSKQLGGTGLGLSIVKHIVQAHHGEVSVKSVLGQGSTFSFTIPNTRIKT